MNASNPNQNFIINRNTILPPEWYEQLQRLRVSFVGSKVFDNALIDPRSQFTILLDKRTSFFSFPEEHKHQQLCSTSTLNMKCHLSKISETVTKTPLDKIYQQFSIAKTFSTPCLNVLHAKVLDLNQLCDTF